MSETTNEKTRIQDLLSRQRELYGQAIEEISSGARRLIAQLPRRVDPLSDPEPVYRDEPLQQAPDIASASLTQAALGCVDNAIRIWFRTLQIATNDIAVDRIDAARDLSSAESSGQGLVFSPFEDDDEEDTVLFPITADRRQRVKDAFERNDRAAVYALVDEFREIAVLNFADDISDSERKGKLMGAVYRALLAISLDEIPYKPCDCSECEDRRERMGIDAGNLEIYPLEVAAKKPLRFSDAAKELFVFRGRSLGSDPADNDSDDDDLDLEDLL